MRILITALFFLSSLVVAYEVSIQQKGKFRLQVDGEIQEQKYTRYNDAVGAAVDEMMRCEECVIFIVSPRFLVEREEVTTPPPIDPPIDPPPIDPPVVVPPPIEPPPTEALAAYYSLTINNGQLVNPKLLGGAVLPPQDVYVNWVGDGINRVKGWCCKPAGGQHNEKDINQLGATSFVLKLRRHAGETKKLELYADVWANNEPYQSIYTFFNVDHTIAPPPAEPATVSWDAPTERADEDDTPLKPGEIGGYIVHVSSIESNSKTLAFNTQDTHFVLDPADLYAADWSVKVAAYDTTPSRECPEDPIPYSCGGPLMSEFSKFIEVEIE